jgi:hypothetical protein
LVQAVSAGGIGILAALVSGFSLSRLSPRERLGVSLSIAGLGVLGISLAGGAGTGSEASWLSLGLWLGGSAATVVTVLAVGRSLLGSAAAFGIATGVAFGAGDVATKATVAGDLALAPVIVIAYGAGTLLLQMGFQRGGALVTAGLATVITNAVPIAAGMTIFHEPLPGGMFGALRVLSFVTLVVSALLLARTGRDDRDPVDSRRQDRRAAPAACSMSTVSPSSVARRCTYSTSSASTSSASGGRS